MNDLEKFFLEFGIKPVSEDLTPTYKREVENERQNEIRNIFDPYSERLNITDQFSEKMLDLLED